MLYVTQLPTFDLNKWYSLRDRIDFEPRYQRKNNLWSADIQRLFINTLLNEYDFPKIYLADFSTGVSQLNESRKLYAVIDGKQRLSTIFNFFDDLIQLDDTPVYIEGDFSVSLAGKTFSDLRYEYAKLAQRVERYTPTVMGVVTDREADIYEMFIRLNLNVSISGPEKRNAMPGPLPPLIRRIAVNPFFKEKISFNTDRSQELSIACQFIMYENNGGFINIKKKDLDNYVKKALHIPSESFLQFVEQVENNLLNMRNCFIHTLDRRTGLVKGDPLLGSTTQMLLYYVLCKEYGNYGYVIREFISFFEKARQAERKKADSRARGQRGLTGLNEIDDQLLRYNSLIRSPDDRNSLSEMFTILRDKFLGFLQTLTNE